MVSTTDCDSVSLSSTLNNHPKLKWRINIMEIFLATTIMLSFLERLNENAGWVCISNCGIL